MKKQVGMIKQWCGEKTFTNILFFGAWNKGLFDKRNTSGKDLSGRVINIWNKCTDRQSMEDN